MLIVEVPHNAVSERAYVLHVILGTVFGLDYTVSHCDPATTVTRIRVSGSARCLELEDCFFPVHVRSPFSAATLPAEALDSWEVPRGLFGETFSSSVPILFGRKSAAGTYAESRGENIWLGIDLFGSAFALLTRYEEAVLDARDEHGRFPWRASVLAGDKLVGRPLVDEYAELLLRSMQRLWPELRVAQGNYSLKVSHDVDQMFSVVGRTWPVVLRSAVTDVISRGDPATAIRRIAARSEAVFGCWTLEPANTFAFIMDVSERLGLQSAFYFIAQDGPLRWDPDYNLDDGRVRRLMRSIHARGHEIGLHGSYGSFRNPTALRGEFVRLREVAEKLRIEQPSWGGRQHYLRWSVGETWAAWADAGFAYDSSLGFAETPGFRCGTCREYPVYDLHARKQLTLLERPLVAMDVSLMSSRYMNLAKPAALEHVTALARACRYFCGTLALLWHNTSLGSRRDREFYKYMLASLV